MTPPLPSTKLALLKSVPLAFLVKFAITFEEVITNQHFKQKHAVADMPSIFVLENHENQWIIPNILTASQTFWILHLYKTKQSFLIFPEA